MKSADGGAQAPVGGSFEVREVSAEVRVAELPAGVECPQTPLAPNDSGWMCDDEALTRRVSQAQAPADELALVVDGKVLSAPHVRDTLTGASVVVSFKGGEADAKAIEAVILGSAG